MKARKVTKLFISATIVLMLLYSFGLESFLSFDQSSGRVSFDIGRFSVGFVLVVLMIGLSSCIFFSEDVSKLRSKNPKHFDALDHQKYKSDTFLTNNSARLEQLNTDTFDLYGNRDGIPATDTPEGELVYGRI